MMLFAAKAHAGEESTGTPGQGSEAIVVTGIQFQYDIASSATKIPLDIKDTPQTVLAVTRDMIDFAGMETFEDIYKIDASGASSHALDSFPRNYYRGFRQQGVNAIKVDGFRMPADINLDLAPYERFEVVKGATSTLYGQNSIAGTLNAISKMPKKNFGGELKLEAGAFDHYRGEVDFYGPLNDDGSLRFRFVGALMDEGSFLDVAEKKVSLFTPTIQADIGPDTTITARLNWQRHDYRYHFGMGLQLLGDSLGAIEPGDLVIPDVPRSTFFGQEWNDAEKEALFLQVLAEHDFGPDFHLRMNGQYNHVTEVSVADEEPLSLKDGTTFYSSIYANDKEDEVFAGEIQLYGDIEAFGQAQTLYVSADYSDHDFSRIKGQDTEAAGFNVFSPDYSLIAPRYAVSDFTNFRGYRLREKEFGITAQLLLRPVEKLTFLLGARYSDTKITYKSNRGSLGSGGLETFEDYLALPFTVQHPGDDALTFQLGATYAVTPEINVYASYGETFEPTLGANMADPDNPAGKPIDPEEGTAYEIGVKAELLDKRLLATLALFDMKRTNIAQDDRTTNFYVPLGTQHAQGIELGLQGEVAEGWDLLLSTAYLDAEFEDGSFEGYRPNNAPKFGLSIFSTYQLLSGPLQGLGVGGGVVHKSGRKTFGSDLTYTNGDYPEYDFGAFTEVDTRIFYDTDDWRFQLSATNLFNEKYYTPVFNSFTFGIQVNPARTIRASVRKRF
ncbi:hypothetical protein B2G71_14285 [Novosphingobium sp. PC22D]|uniref:TonB-dependent siderophore receptor n=1 Tax=Novosphingobium sp. PC22D TaxID=1962403 RepID=UPI000BFAFC69|nr:TonB-dependent siderophore receptor [Novosphingobium sp. PC22D]PEQ11947.1 hypothetical protein B2G71_14285 [Novosphingobium sp. PC22D]